MGNKKYIQNMTTEELAACLIKPLVLSKTLKNKFLKYIEIIKLIFYKLIL